jgi:hypothetical protein
VLLDTSLGAQESLSEQQQQQQQQHADDDRTIVSTMDAAASTSGGRPHRRRVSSGNVSVSSTDTATTSVTSSATASSTPAGISIDISKPTIVTRSGSAAGMAAIKLANLEENDEEMEQEGNEEQAKQPLARIVLQHRETQRQYSKGLDFRPLSPRATILDSNVGRGGKGAATVGVWVGSADDTKLRLFKNSNDDTSEALVDAEICLNGSLKTGPISFQSPVMAIDCVSLPGSSTAAVATNEEQSEELAPPLGQSASTCTRDLVAVACQDGTIGFYGYTWSATDLVLHCQEECTVVVDGPIVSVHLNVKGDGCPGQTTVEAVVGSLCGYAARFYKKLGSSGHDSETWQGPFMVAEGFGTGPDAQEDSILAVHAWDDKVALGTFSGRCLLYGKDGNEGREDYGLPYWDCQLPDPIHGICHLPAVDNQEETVQLLVTTRRSIHVFQETPKVYDPERTKRKVELLLSRQRHNASTSAISTISANLSQPVEDLGESKHEEINGPVDEPGLPTQSDGPERQIKLD